MKQEKKDAGKELAQQATGTSPVAETHPAERVAARDPLARIGKYLDHDALVALADHLEEMNPAYPGAFDFTFMRSMVCPGIEIGTLAERLTGLSEEQSLGNYATWGVEYADITTLGQHALGMVATDDATSPVEVDEDDDLLHVDAGRASVLLGLVLTKVLLTHDTRLAYTMLNKAHKLVELATTLPGLDKREEATANFTLRLQKLAVLLTEAFTKIESK